MSGVRFLSGLLSFNIRKYGSTIVRELKIKIPGFTIAAKSWGDECGKPILCLHGMLDNAASFDFLAPLLPDFYVVAIDFPGTGHSSRYPEGVIPSWRNDTFLLFHIVKSLGWSACDIIAHSLGSLSATSMAMSKRNVVRKMILLDVIGPKLSFLENRGDCFDRDVDYVLNNKDQKHTEFPSEEEAIRERMKIGNISHKAAQALVSRGTKNSKQGVVWDFDQRLRCVGFTLPFEDELLFMLRGLDIPVCLIRAERGIPYPETVFQARCQAVKQLQMHFVSGGHHVHMDDPVPIANIAAHFFR